MSHRSTTTEKVSTSLIRLTREDSERHDWFVVTVTEELTRTKFGSDPEILSGSLGLKVRPVNEYALDRGVPTTFGGRFEHHVPDITRATVKVTDGYVIIEDKANRGRGLGTHLMSQVVHWLQTHAQGDAIMFPVELELGISDAQAERVRRFYARFGLRFEEDKDGRLRTTGWTIPLRSLVTPPTPVDVTVYGEVEGWLAFFAEVRQADERRHGDQLGNQWRSQESRVAEVRRHTWLKAGAAFAFAVLVTLKLLH